MHDNGVISKITEPILWCAGILVVSKSDGRVRICGDLTRLNREQYQLLPVEESLSKLRGAKVFSKLDANSGFWQIPLHKDSQHLTTFLNPFGQYCFNRLPFGITSALEHFRYHISTILQGLQWVNRQVDDILVFALSQEEHDQCLAVVLDRLGEANVTLNSDKCEFSKSTVTFPGHVIDHTGIWPDPNKVNATVRMKDSWEY